MRETASKYKKEAARIPELEAKVKELQNKPAATPPDYEELKQFRAIFDTERDPEFKSKYDNKIAESIEKSHEILKKNGATDEFIESIKKAGGIDKVDYGWLKSNVLDKLEGKDALLIQRNILDAGELSEQRAKEIALNAEKRPEFLAKKETAQKEQMQKQMQEIEQYTVELTKEIPWANYRQASPDATPEQKAEVDKHNDHVKVLAQQYQRALWPSTPMERAHMATAAVASQVLVEQVKIEQGIRAKQEAQIKQLSDELSKIKSASRVPKASPTNPSYQNTSTLSERINMNAMDAIDLGLAEASGG